MRKLRILFLEPQPCIRALKYGNALKSYLGDNVSLCFAYTGMPLNALYGHGDESFDRMVKLNPKETDGGIRCLIDSFNPSLIHSHNAPNNLTLSAINVAKDVPIIHDVHEILSIHNSGFKKEDNAETLKRYSAEERRANEESDGRIYPTEGIAEYIQQHYKVNTENDLIFYNYPSESVMPRNFRKKISERDGEAHIVYIGCITSVVEGSHYDLRNIFKDIAHHGMHIHIYPTKNIITQSNRSYKKIADANDFIHFHDNMNQKELLEEITQYDFGWAGFNMSMNHEHLNVALPNKVMEYIGCGLPVLAFSHKTIHSLIEKHEVGWLFNNLNELDGLLKSDNLTNIKKNVLNVRHQLAIEGQIPRVVKFYKQITG